MHTKVIQITGWGEENYGFERIFDWLQKYGLTMANPLSGRVTGWDDAGEQFTTTEDEVRRSIGAGGQGSVQMWFDEGDDVYISWNANQVRIYLDGRNFEQHHAVLRAVLYDFVDALEGPIALWKVCIGLEDVI